MKQFNFGQYINEIFFHLGIATIILFIISCNMLKGKNHSYWGTQKNKFKHRNLSEFVSDSLLRTNIKSCYSQWHKSLDSISSNKKVYLYSWQDRDTTKNEFTVVHDRGELGLNIYYLIFDKNDKLLSMTDLAGAGNEGGYIFETRSKFINRDSIFQIRAITQWLDFERGEKMDKPIGDSTFLSLTIDDTGKVTEKILKEVKELNYDNK